MTKINVPTRKSRWWLKGVPGGWVSGPQRQLAERRQGPRWCVGATHSLPLWTARLIVVSRGRADGSLSVLLMRSSGLSVAAWDRQPDYRDEGLSCCFQEQSCVFLFSSCDRLFSICERDIKFLEDVCDVTSCWMTLLNRPGFYYLVVQN